MSKSIAIIGASTDRGKYGNKAVRAFRDGGWTVYPVNPTAEEVEGLPCYASVTQVPEPLTRVAMYVPPEIGKTLLRDIASKHPEEFFLNPGSADAESWSSARRRSAPSLRRGSAAPGKAAAWTHQ